MNNRLAFILGIRPDVIRASLIIKHLRRYADCELHLIWSGQHYSDNLKGIFVRELDVVPAEIDLACGGETDAHIAASVISGLYPVLRDLDPAAAVFLGDNNTTLGAIAAAQLNVPVVHIEGCMRSYDWGMPEEKYRTTIDHLADVIYAYVDEYKTQGIREGLNPANIVVVGNPIVDVLEHYYFSRLSRYEAMMTDAFFADRGVRRGEYYLMTCHRRENVEQRAAPESYPSPTVFGKLESLIGTRWTHNLGDGRTSERIAEDLHRCLVTGNFSRHRPEHYHVPIDRSYRGDGLDT